MASTKPRAVVIGSGFGGLSVAIRLQSAGFDTEILESRDKPGGRAYVWEQDGFKFDAGPTVITAPEAIEELYELSKRKFSDYVTMKPLTPFYRLLWWDGYQFDYSNDEDELFRQIREKNPQDVEGYQRFYEYSKEVFQEGYVKLGTVPFLDFWSMIRCAPQLMKLQAHRSVYSIVSKYIKDRHLREAFSFHSLLVGGNPFSASSIYTLIHHLERQWGVHFPMGGTGALVQGMVKLFEDLGGKIHYNSPVDAILTENKKVTGVKTQDGTVRKVPLVVSNADVHYTYNHLLKDDSVTRARARRLNRMNYSMSLFLIYFGTKKQYRGKLAHHNVIFGPRYKGLLKNIFGKQKQLAEDFSLYLHVPTVSDPSVAPEGCDAFYALSPVPHLGDLEVDWEKEAPRYRDRIMNFLEERYLPNLRNEIVTERVFTPNDFKTVLNAHMGNAFSLTPLLTQSAYFRQHNRDDHLEGMYFVGAGTHPGAGIPGVVGSAKATASTIMSDIQEKRIELGSMPQGMAYA